jgi:hypothetical protein
MYVFLSSNTLMAEQAYQTIEAGVDGVHILQRLKKIGS